MQEQSLLLSPNGKYGMDTLELISHRALCHHESSPHQLLVNLRETALLLIPQCPYQGNHIQSELPVRQCPSSFFFWTRWMMAAGTFRIATTIHFESQTPHTLSGAYRPMTVVAHAHPTSTHSTPDLKRFECHL